MLNKRIVLHKNNAILCRTVYLLHKNEYLRAIFDQYLSLCLHHTRHIHPRSFL